MGNTGIVNKDIEFTKLLNYFPTILPIAITSVGSVERLSAFHLFLALP